MPACLYKLPDNLSFEEGAILEPSCNAYKAVVQEGRVLAGEVVAVFGPGPVGLFAVQLAKLAGASLVFLFGLPGDEYRLEVGKSLGADVVTTLDKVNTLDVVREHLKKSGVDLVIDAAGAGVVLRDAIEIIRPLGRIVKVGWTKRPYPINLDPLMQKGAVIIGHFGYDHVSWRNILNMAERRRVQYRPLITKTYSLNQWKEAFSTVENKKVVKVVFNQF